MMIFYTNLAPISIPIFVLISLGRFLGFFGLITTHFTYYVDYVPERTTVIG